MRLLWATDPHLNHVPPDAWDRWIKMIRETAPDAVLITGDISEGDDVVFQLNRVAETIAVPIYFVLGNHDFYQSSIGQTRQDVIYTSRANPSLTYLTDSSIVSVAKDVYLIGEDGWGDASVGDYENSPIRLNDFLLIKDFQGESVQQSKAHLLRLGRESAERLEKKLDMVPMDARHVLVATHVPPFREACWYQGKTTDDNWAPFFVCGEIGESLRRFSTSRPSCQVTVVCGHTHHRGMARLADNLVVYTGGADYGEAALEAIIEITNGQLRLEAKSG